ncbi:PhoU family transcriptional regulator [Sporosarcina sp. ANT_H38]|uniref:PhoU family transcriptional regulator n=1 Tax=Sporosarcina sp. ANT_H38 TaxID=2597358 RepID=UPI0011F26BB0|nr:PhoU family transcriptional regulator [Sporosarcina sp. ANT_H38]KAA0948789.1 PhoU family transcriptional regulator [Sporosarcina sp. ANT_H38]
MKKLLSCLSCIFILVACSNEDNANLDKETVITKEFVEEYAKVGLTYSEVREKFGTEELADVVDNTETWLYDSSQHNDFKYDRSLEAVAFDEIKSDNLDYQLYINFIEEKSYMYSYFYKGEDGKVWQYQIAPNSEPSSKSVSN